MVHINQDFPHKFKKNVWSKHFFVQLLNIWFFFAFDCTYTILSIHTDLLATWVTLQTWRRNDQICRHAFTFYETLVTVNIFW